MRILYLSQYFPPEAGATQTRAYEMARNLVNCGHKVSVLTELPNHPSGIFPPEYHGKLYQRQTLEGMDIIRVWVKTSPVKNFRKRMLFYLSYMLNATLAGLVLARGRYDVIYASSPPLFVGGAALALSYLRRTALVFEVRDLWPESAVALGELSSQKAINWATRLEEACYRRARAIVVVTQGIRRRLAERGLPTEKLILIPNGANLERFRPLPEARQQIRQTQDWTDKFVVAYTGIFGLAYHFETIFEAAHRLRVVPNIQFVLIGNGPRKEEILHRQAELDLPNLAVLPEQPYERIPEWINAADAMLIPLAKNPFFAGTLPVKMFDAWACQLPVLLCCVPGEASLALERAQGGLFLPPEDPQALTVAIQKLANDPEACRSMGESGRAYTRQHFSRRALARLLADLLESLSK